MFFNLTAPHSLLRRKMCITLPWDGIPVMNPPMSKMEPCKKHPSGCFARYIILSMHLSIVLLGFISPCFPFLYFLCLGPSREGINKELTLGDAESISSLHNICVCALCIRVRMGGKLSTVDPWWKTFTYRIPAFFFFLETLKNSLNSSARWSLSEPRLLLGLIHFPSKELTFPCQHQLDWFNALDTVSAKSHFSNQ